MGARYYTETISGPQFQIRIPTDLRAHLAFSSLSVPMVPAPRLALRCRALDLAGAARRLFAELRAMDSDDLKTLTREELVRRIDTHCEAEGIRDFSDQSDEAVRQRNREMNGLLAATAELFSRPAPVRSLGDKLPSLPVKGLITLQRRHAEGEYLIDAEFDGCLERLFQAAMGNPALQTIMAGLPVMNALSPQTFDHHAEAAESRGRSPTIVPPHLAADTSVAALSCSSEEARGKETDAASAPSARSVPEVDFRISAAFTAYRTDLVSRKGPDSENVANLDSRARMFHAICGDPDLRTLTNLDLKRFAYAIAHLPAKVARDGSWTDDTLKPILEGNGWVDRFTAGNEAKPSIVREPTISERTWTDKTFGPVKTAIKQYAGTHGIPLLLQDFPLHLPDHMPRSKDRDSPPTHLVNELIGYGIDDGRLVQAILPSLASLTGRRIALLAHLRAENFAQEAGHWVAWADRDYTDENDGIIKRCGVKTSESLRPFVVHEIFEKCGFIDYVTRLGTGWVFPSLHIAGISSPGATAQKRMGTLTEKIQNRTDDNAARERGRAGFVFHQLRHYLLGAFREEALGDRLERKQTGRAPADAHGRYAYSFKPNEISRVATRNLDSLPAAQRLLELDIAAAARRCLTAAEREQRRKTRGKM